MFLEYQLLIIYSLQIVLKKSMLSFTVSTPCIIESTNYYRHDIVLRLYTKSIKPGPFTQTRKFQFMSWLATMAHNSGFNSLKMYRLPFNKLYRCR